MFVKPPGPRHTAIEQADGLTIRIPSQCQIFAVAFLTFWLCGWLFGEIMAPIAFLHVAKRDLGPGLFLLAWLGMWTVGGALAIYSWLWQVKGCEVVTISSTALSIKREIFGFGRTKHYDVSEIRELRVAPLAYAPFDARSRMAFGGMAGGALAFDYGSKTYRFGAGVDEAEARIILQSITSRLPHLSKPGAPL